MSSTQMDRFETLLARLETVASRLENVAPGTTQAILAPSTPAPEEEEEVAPIVAAFDELIATHVVPFTTAATALGGDAAAAGATVAEAFNAQRAFLHTTSRCKKPSDAELPLLLEATSKCMIALSDPRRQSEFYNHLKAVADGIQALAWVIQPAPAPHAESMIGGAEFYGNKVRREHKGDKAHFAFVDGWRDLLKALHVFVKANARTGVMWNAQGGNAVDYHKMGSTAPAATTTRPASAEVPAVSASSTTPAAAKRGADFEASLAASLAASRKHVTADMKTKNRKDKTTVVSASTPVSRASVASKVKSTVPERCEFDFDTNRWVFEGLVGRKDLVVSVDECEISHTVYLYKCRDCVVQVQGKVNAVSIDACSKCAVVFTDVVSMLEVVHSQSMQLQVTGVLRTAVFDSSSSVSFYISAVCSPQLDVITSKCDAINLLPEPAEGEEPKELAVPTQFVTKIVGGAAVTVPSSSIGSD
jgi:adenylyl cyclase-associated protein